MDRKRINEWMAAGLAASLILTIANIHEPLHYVFGTLFFGLVAVHLSLHDKWIHALANGGRDGRPQPVHRRINLWLFYVLLTCAITGFLALASKFGVIGGDRHQIFHYSVLHALSGVLGIMAMAVHLVMHRKWLAAVIKRNLGIPNRSGRAEAEG